MKPSHKSFKLKFKHITARVTVQEYDNAFCAFIVFPKAYIMPHLNNYFIPQITATNMQYACEMAASQFREFYAPLNERIREIGKHNFFLCRVRFRTAEVRAVDDFKASFAFTRHYYCIVENVDGGKYNKTTYAPREFTKTWNALFNINAEDVFFPLRNLGFNHKFIHRLLNKHNIVKESDLRIWDKGQVIDTLETHPHKLDNHISEQREDFMIAMGLHRNKRL